MFVIFLFAALPLPDDLILVPLGMLRYSLRKALIAAFFGKVVMCVAVAYAGRYSFELVRDIFVSGGPLGGVASIVLLALLLVAMIKIDWTRLLGKEKVEEED